MSLKAATDNGICRVLNIGLVCICLFLYAHPHLSVTLILFAIGLSI